MTTPTLSKETPMDIAPDEEDIGEVLCAHCSQTCPAFIQVKATPFVGQKAVQVNGAVLGLPCDCTPEFEVCLYCWRDLKALWCAFFALANGDQHSVLVPSGNPRSPI